MACWTLLTRGRSRPSPPGPTPDHGEPGGGLQGGSGGLLRALRPWPWAAVGSGGGGAVVGRTRGSTVRVEH